MRKSLKLSYIFFLTFLLSGQLLVSGCGSSASKKKVKPKKDTQIENQLNKVIDRYSRLHLVPAILDGQAKLSFSTDTAAFKVNVSIQKLHLSLLDRGPWKVRFAEEARGQYLSQWIDFEDPVFIKSKAGTFRARIGVILKPKQVRNLIKNSPKLVVLIQPAKKNTARSYVLKLSDICKRPQSILMASHRDSNSHGNLCKDKKVLDYALNF